MLGGRARLGAAAGGRARGDAPSVAGHGGGPVPVLAIGELRGGGTHSLIQLADAALTGSSLRAAVDPSWTFRLSGRGGLLGPGRAGDPRVRPPVRAPVRRRFRRFRTGVSHAADPPERP